MIIGHRSTYKKETAEEYIEELKRTTRGLLDPLYPGDWADLNDERLVLRDNFKADFPKEYRSFVSRTFVPI